MRNCSEVKYICNYKNDKDMAVEVSTDQEFKEIINSGKPVAVKYFAGWCGSCKLFAPKFRRLSNDERFEGIRFLDIDAENNEEARKMAGVDNLPFIATFKDGKLIEGSATSKEELVVKMLENLK